MKQKISNEVRYWLYTNYGKANECEHCKRTDRKRYCWTIKKDAECKRNRAHFIQLCFSCVQKYHEGVKIKWATDKEWRQTMVKAGQEKVFTPEHRHKLTEGHIKANGMQIRWTSRRYTRYKSFFHPNHKAKEFLDKILQEEIE